MAVRSSYQQLPSDLIFYHFALLLLLLLLLLSFEVGRWDGRQASRQTGSRITQLQHYRKLALFIASRTTIPAALQRPQSSQFGLLLLWAVAELVCGRSLWAAFVGGRRAESGDGILLVAEIYAKETRLADLPTPRTRINTTYMIQEACVQKGRIYEFVCLSRGRRVTS